jgi:hypothetical protein
VGKAFRPILLIALALCMGPQTRGIVWGDPVNADPAALPALEYPSALLDLHDADGSCWTGMDAAGAFPARVVPEEWLVGPPPSQESALTLPTDHWVELAFSGRLAAGDGNDILLVETGKAGEQALLFVTDGADQEYLLDKVVVENSSRQDLSRLGFDLDGVVLPFVPRAVRVVALDLGGQSPGFDLGNMQARVSHECGPKAGCPNPVSGAAGVSPYTKLTWTPGSAGNEQVIYFGEVASEVGAAAARVRYPLPPGDVNTFEPAALGLGRTYYWRVDEVRDQESGVGDQGSQTDSLPPARGDVWSFTVADHLVIDDFEAYDLQKHFLYETWQTRGWAGVSIEQGIVRSCRQSMSVHYHYDATWFSEIARVFETPQDWAYPQAEVLQILVRGTAGNGVRGGVMYLTLTDGHTEQTVPYAGDLGFLADPRWNAWRIALADFDRIDLAHVASIAIGLRSPTADPLDRGIGTIYIDDITLHPALCLQNRDPAGAEGRPQADLTADCRVDFRDLQRLAQDWLHDRTRIVAVAAPNEPTLWYDFDGDATDLVGTADGHIHGRCNFISGVYGLAIDFTSQGDTVTIPEAASVFSHAREAITIAFWQRGYDSTHLNDTVCCSNYVYGQSNPALAIHLGCWRNPGQYRWDCGFPWSFESRLAGRHRDKTEWAGRWNHWAFTKDIRVGPDGHKGRMEIYLNGELYDRREGTDTPIAGITSFEIGTGWYGRYDGVIDDFRIYDYALSPAEVAHVATRGTGIFPQGPDSVADLNGDGTVNLRDLATLATQWLQSDLWP